MAPIMTLPNLTLVVYSPFGLLSKMWFSNEFFSTGLVEERLRPSQRWFIPTGTLALSGIEKKGFSFYFGLDFVFGWFRVVVDVFKQRRGLFHSWKKKDFQTVRIVHISWQDQHPARYMALTHILYLCLGGLRSFHDSVIGLPLTGCPCHYHSGNDTSKMEPHGEVRRHFLNQWECYYQEMRGIEAVWTEQERSIISSDYR